MAAPFRFYKIGEANAEIERLTAENISLNGRISAMESNPGEAVANAEKAIAEKDAEISRVKSESDRLAKQISDNASDLKTANDKLAAMPAEIENAASLKAKEIAAAQGIPPVKDTPPANPKANSAKIDPTLKGIEKAYAAHAAATANDPAYAK